MKRTKLAQLEQGKARIRLRGIVSVLTFSMASAFGQQPGSGASAQMKSALLVSNGFTLYLDCYGPAGTAQAIFAEKDDKVFVTISSPGLSCERELRLAGEGFEYDSCTAGTSVRVAYQSSNANVPFKGAFANGRCTVELKPK